MSLDVGLNLLVCPVCRQPLGRDGGAVHCPSGHAYDVARQGYVNLSGGPSPANADTANMVSARADFLGSGHFDTIAEAVVAAVPRDARTVLDCGAGTGYYAKRLLEACADRRALALDVSIAAIRRAAGTHERMAAVVSDAWRPLPVADSVIDAIVSIFAPRNAAEFHRVLVSGGFLITVVPAPDHLIELREPLDLLEVQPAKSDHLAASLGGHFRADSEDHITVRQSWSAGTARNAVLMGPNAFHVPPAELDQRLARLRWPLEVTLSCLIGAWTARLL